MAGASPTQGTSAEDKLRIMQLAIRRLADAGYAYIGMDHFARPDDELAVAQRHGRLHRDFQAIRHMLTPIAGIRRVLHQQGRSLLCAELPYA